MFKKLINDTRSEEWNIVMFTIIIAVSMILILTPIVFIGLSLHPELSETLTKAPETSSEEMIETINSTKAVIEMFIYGTVAEFIRRKKSQKFKITDNSATKFLFYFTVELFIYNALSILGGILI